MRVEYFFGCINKAELFLEAKLLHHPNFPGGRIRSAMLPLKGAPDGRKPIFRWRRLHQSLPLKKRLSSSAWCFLRICWRSIFSNLRWMKTNWVAEFRPLRAIFHWAVWFGKLIDTAFEKRTRWRHLLWKPQLVVLYTGLYCSFIWGLQQMPLQACCHSPTSFVATALLILWFRCPLERRLRCWLLRTAVHAAVVHGSPGFL